ncbi:hypothetical protein APHAL10511_000482 [Amanita phalloides]|nr:hypothetical protein APHAL10511_000482 [Amanita phalloides]
MEPPSPALGRIPKELTADRVEQAISVGLIHVEASPVYCNEEQVGKAIRGSGLNRGEIYITTKYAAFDPDNSRVDVLTSVNNSLKRCSWSIIYRFVPYSSLSGSDP